MASKKREIQEFASELDYEDRLHVLQILKQHIPHKIIEHADGSRVNLDTISDTLLDNLYHIIKNRPSMMNTQYN